MADLPRVTWALIPALLAGIAGTGVALHAREGDAAFEFAQRHPKRVQPENLAELVAKAREPVAGGDGARADRARCTSRGSDDLGNPWVCTVRYASGRTLRYRIRVAPDGSMAGSSRAGYGEITGCCVATPSQR